MKRIPPGSRPWSLIRSASGTLGYGDPLALRRGAVHRIRPASRTTLVHGTSLAKKSSSVELS